MRILVTGGAGFIGSNFIRYVLRAFDDWRVVNLDKLTYAGNLENLADIEHEPRYRFVRGDIADTKGVAAAFDDNFDVVVNFAAESHVDRSILDASPFIRTNVMGTQILLDAAREHRVNRFIQISTDEVYGSLEPGMKSTEEARLLPNSPYAASKASADVVCRAHFQTYATPIIITRCSNNYGPFQFPEKLIPLAIGNAHEDRAIPIYGDGLNIRDWIHVDDHCRAIAMVIRDGRPGEIYNVGAHNEMTNVATIERLLAVMGKPMSLMTFVSDRPGHDRRYALDSAKIRRELGWTTATSFETGLRGTVEWYQQNAPWWQRIRSGEYADYYERLYTHR